MSTTSTFDGEFVWPLDEEAVARTPYAIEALSDICFVQLRDRRILAVFVYGSKIYEAYSPDMSTILEEDGWIDDPEHSVSQKKTEILAGQFGTPRISVTEVDGEVYLAVLDNDNVDGLTGMWLYRRTGPASWTLYGAGPSSTWIPSSFGFIGTMAWNVGLITVFNGIWIMPCSQIFRDSIGGSSFHDWHAAIVASVDNGVTWNWVDAFGGGSGRGFQQARDIQVYNGVLYWSANFNVSGTFVVTSSDGLTWLNHYVPTLSGPDGSMAISPLLVDDNYLYFTPSSSVYRTTDILDRDTWEVVETYTASLQFSQLHMARVGNYYLWVDAFGRVVGIPVGGCVPHETAVALASGGHVRVLTDMVRIGRIMLKAAITDPREKCAPCSPANARATKGRSRARLKKVF